MFMANAFRKEHEANLLSEEAAQYRRLAGMQEVA
jgi:hypothetical protein